ncbi:MAG: ATP-binding protein [Nannocystales bacterium]
MEFQDFLEVAPDAMVVMAPDGVITLVNAQTESLFGYTRGELVGERIELLIPERFRMRHPEHREGYFCEPEKRGMGAGLELWGLRKDGREIPIEISLSPVKTDSGMMVSSSIRDISDRLAAREERARMERQLQAGQRMEAVGRLAGGVAHDFNNVLTVIRTYTVFLCDKFSEGDPVREDLDVILDASERATRLVAQLLAFSRRQIQELRVVNLDDEVSNVGSMLRRLIGTDIGLRMNLDEGLGRVRVDPTQVEQVLMNLAINARDAMPDGGDLTIETANVEISEGGVTEGKTTVPPGSYVMISMTDTGCGMNEETQNQMFEPFFSTKAQGTGLGLSTVFGIVKQSNGYLRVDSEVGKGTTFKVYLPRVDTPAATPKPQRAKALPLAGSERILLVEDEEMVRRAVSRILRARGYDVLEAVHGGDALEVAGEHGQQIDLVLTDVIMPEMGGRELAERLTVRWPGLKVVYMSGYTDDAVVHQSVLDEGVAFVQKPFTPSALLSKIRAVLDR